MTTPRQPRTPRGLSTTGQFATGAKKESTIDLPGGTPHPDDPFDGYRLDKVNWAATRALAISPNRC